MKRLLLLLSFVDVLNTQFQKTQMLNMGEELFFGSNCLNLSLSR